MYTISRIHTLIKPVMHGVSSATSMPATQTNTAKHSKITTCLSLCFLPFSVTVAACASWNSVSTPAPASNYHLHTRTIYRSTLADALARKSITPFITLAQSLMQSANRKMRQDGKTLLYLLDSTIIDLRAAALTNGHVLTTTAAASSCTF